MQDGSWFQVGWILKIGELLIIPIKVILIQLIPTARKSGKKFLFKGNRYNTDYKGTPQQQLKETEYTNDRLGIKNR